MEDGSDGKVGDDAGVMVVRREMVKDWAKSKGVDTIDPVREEGFLGEWAASDAEDDEEDEDEEDQEEIEDSQDE